SIGTIDLAPHRPSSCSAHITRSSHLRSFRRPCNCPSPSPTRQLPISHSSTPLPSVPCFSPSVPITLQASAPPRSSQPLHLHPPSALASFFHSFHLTPPSSLSNPNPNVHILRCPLLYLHFRPRTPAVATAPLTAPTGIPS
ncbi:hypothetical protein C8R44DRAFT_796714, partial [Mycena epipterygia]